MTIQSIESQDISLSKLFGDFYVVPDYQREYIWEHEQVEQLLDDVYTEFSSSADSANQYFIGSIVVCTRPDGLFELIDGQQRVTTSYIFLCALRDYLKGTGEAPIVALGPQIAATEIDAEGNDVFRYRVDLQYEDSGDILKVLAAGNYDPAKVTIRTQSIENITNAHRFIRTFLDGNFANDVQQLRKFYAFFTKNVRLIRIQTQSVAQALKIFETINDRGKGLDSMDLLKNLMFMKAKKQDFDKLKVLWKDLVDTLYGAKEKPLRFLRYYIFGQYSVDRLREDEIYDWFVRNKKLCGYEADPIGFVKELGSAARAYVNFLQGKDVHGRPQRFLSNIRYMSGAARQHLILLLAARQLPDRLFEDLSRHVENLFFVHIITRENTREFERRFAQWAGELRNINHENDLRDFISQRFEPSTAALYDRFVLTFRSLDEDSIQKYRMRYVLGKLTQHVNEQAYGSTGAEIDLDTFINSKVHVEHILPQSPTPEIIQNFDKEDQIFSYVPRIGNLTLVEEPINTSLSNKPFDEKRPVYAKSKFLLTRSIAEHVTVGARTSIDRATEKLITFESWNSRAIDRRQEMLGQLATDVWEMQRGFSSKAITAEKAVSSPAAQTLEWQPRPLGETKTEVTTEKLKGTSAIQGGTKAVKGASQKLTAAQLLANALGFGNAVIAALPKALRQHAMWQPSQGRGHVVVAGLKNVLGIHPQQNYYRVSSPYLGSELPSVTGLAVQPSKPGYTVVHIPVSPIAYAQYAVAIATAIAQKYAMGSERPHTAKN